MTWVRPARGHGQGATGAGRAAARLSGSVRSVLGWRPSREHGRPSSCDSEGGAPTLAGAASPHSTHGGGAGGPQSRHGGPGPGSERVRRDTDTSVVSSVRSGQLRTQPEEPSACDCFPPELGARFGWGGALGGGGSMLGAGNGVSGRRGDDDSEYLVFRIVDTGVGLSKEDLNRIFEPCASSREPGTRNPPLESPPASDFGEVDRAHSLLVVFLLLLSPQLFASQGGLQSVLRRHGPRAHHLQTPGARNGAPVNTLNRFWPRAPPPLSA